MKKLNLNYKNLKEKELEKYQDIYGNKIFYYLFKKENYKYKVNLFNYKILLYIQVKFVLNSKLKYLIFIIYLGYLNNKTLPMENHIVEDLLNFLVRNLMMIQMFLKCYQQLISDLLILHNVKNKVLLI